MRKLTKKQQAYADGIAQGRFDCTMNNLQELDRLKRMLRWIILDRCNDTIKKMHHGSFPDKDLEEMLWEKPDISDIMKDNNEV